MPSENTEYSRVYLDSLLGSEVSKICKQLGIKSTGVKPHLIKTILDFQNSENTNTKVAKTKSKTTKTTTTTASKPSKPIAKKVTKPSPKPSKPKAKLSKKPAATTATTTATTPPAQPTTAITTPPAQPTTTTTATTTLPETSTTATTTLPETSTTATTTLPETSTIANNSIIPEVSSSAATNENAAPPPTTTTTAKTEFKHDGDPDNEVIALRMNREGCNTGELHASLIWNDIADLDLHVITPSGEHLFYGHKESRCGGWLDKDMNVQVTNDSEHPIENIFWASAPSGKYKIYVNHFRCHTSSDPRFQSSSRSVPFRVRLIKEGKTEWFQGTVKPNGNVTCFEFNLNGSGAVGSFVVLPPNNVPSTFKELCEKNKVSYSQGEGYYALKRKEEISEIKDMVLHNTQSDTFIIGHSDVCLALNQPTNKRLTLTPAHLPPDTRLFVQSTSHNRKIPADTHVLMRVSVKEALTFRQSSKYNFK
ncbi:hypothetical protein ACTFIU_003181 [Dictyostelium citrinum]